MASRLYRDYTLQDDPFGVPPRRTLSIKAAYDPASPSRTVITEIKADDVETIASPKYGTGTAHSTDDIRTSHLHDYGTGIAETTDEDDVTPYRHDNLQPLDLALDGPPDDGIRKSAFSPSMTSVSRVSHDAQSSSGSSGSRLPEFFSKGVFQVVLNNPTISSQLLKFGQSRLCGENMEFLARVSKYHALLADVSKAIYEIHKDFIAHSAPSQINLPEGLLVKTNNEMKASLTLTVPKLESVFVDSQADIENLIHTDIYPKFVRYQMSLSAARALGGNRAKYGGLGDCFVLTDPAKADNPIMYASDGFVKVTGYARNEIIPRNCRFLQCHHTDKAAVRRLKNSIEKRQQSVELLLNQKKDGQYFWNLLYTTPLFDGNGKVVFFLGGQINCSTTIHSASDVLRILAQTEETEEDLAPRAISPQPVKQSRSRSIIAALRSNSRPTVQMRAPGMENSLLDRIEDKDLKSQMDTFYTAYSNFIVINYSTYLVSFISAGIIELLFPIKAKASDNKQAVGTDIFKYLANHGSGSLGWDFKAAVKNALRMGQPISVDLKLCARPYMGFERFALHWTPLKDEVGAVAWIVLSLGSDQRS